MGITFLNIEHDSNFRHLLVKIDFIIIKRYPWQGLTINNRASLKF